MIPVWLTAMGLAQAGVLSTYGGGMVGSAGNAGATVHSPMAAWNNPAAMRTPRIEQSAEWLTGSHRFTDNGAPFHVTDDARGLLLGVVASGYWFNVPEVSVGLASYMPAAGPYAWREAPEGWDKTSPTAQVPRLADELNRMEVALATQARLTPWLSVGVGVDASADVETITIAELNDIERPETARKSQQVDIRPTFHPYAGLLVEVGAEDAPQMRLGLVGRTARAMEDFGESWVQIIKLNAVYAHRYRRHQAPRSITMGAGFDGLGPFSVRAESTWAEWSSITGPYGEDLGQAYRDTVDLRLGLQAELPGLTLALGRQAAPSPMRHVPTKTAHLDGPERAWTVGLKRHLVETRQRDLSLLLGLQRTRIGGLVPDPSGAEHRLRGKLTAVRLGLMLGHKGESKEAFWSK